MHVISDFIVALGEKITKFSIVDYEKVSIIINVDINSAKMAYRQRACYLKI